MGWRIWGVCALAALAAACGAQPDPLAEARAACGDAERVAAEQAAACTELLESGDLDEANRAVVLANRGSANLRMSEPTAALRDFDAALAANSGNMHAVMGRAAVLIDSGQLDAAAPLVAQLIASGEFADRAHFLDGNIAAQRGDTNAAIAAYDAALEINPAHVSALANRARMRTRLEDYPAALADYGAALAADPAYANALSGRCWLYVISGAENDLARADADAAVAADPANIEGQLCRGLLQLRAEQWQEARASYDAALALQPGNPAALFGRGVARRRSGDEEGRADMNQARDFDRHIASAFADLGVRSF